MFDRYIYIYLKNYHLICIKIVNYYIINKIQRILFALNIARLYFPSLFLIAKSNQNNQTSSIVVELAVVNYVN